MERIKEMIYKLYEKQSEIPQKTKLAVLFCIALGIVAFLLPTEPKHFPREEQAMAQVSGNEEEKASQLLEYEQCMERKVEDALQYVEGAGKVHVVISFRSSAEKVIEKEQNQEERNLEEKDASGGVRKEQEKHVEEKKVYTHPTNGEERPYVKKEITPKVEGILIVAEGGDNAVVVKNMTEALQALFGIDAHKIKIMKRVDT